MLDGTGGSLDFQINTGGLNLLGVDRITFDAFKSDVNVDKLGLETAGVGRKTDAQQSLSFVDKAIENVSSIRGDLGAIENRLTSSIRNLGISIENLSAANSRIKDVDIASETSELTKGNILMQAGTAVLAQANAAPKSVLTLLQNQ